VEGPDETAVGDGIGGPAGGIECIGVAVFEGLGHGVVVSLEAVDLGLERVVVALLVEATSVVEEKLREVLGDDPRRRGEALDVEHGEGDAAASHGRESRIEFAAQETVETVGADGMDGARRVQEEDAATVGLHTHI